MSQRTITVSIDIEAADDFTDYDLHDVIRFHLDLSTLNDVEVDVSAVRITNARLYELTRVRSGLPVRADPDPALGLPGKPVVWTGGFRELTNLYHAHDEYGRCVKNRWRNPRECEA